LKSAEGIVSREKEGNKRTERGFLNMGEEILNTVLY